MQTDTNRHFKENVHTLSLGDFHVALPMFNLSFDCMNDYSATSLLIYQKYTLYKYITMRYYGLTFHKTKLCGK